MAFTRPFTLICVFLAVSLASFSHANEPVLLPIHPDALEIVTIDGRSITSFNIEIAATSDQRATGLMHRKDFGGNAAMLFDFQFPRNIAMWMKNTPSPLDMLFAGSDGKILAIERDTTPFSLAVISPNVLSKYVLEIGAGEAKLRDIQVGQFLRHPNIESSLK